MTGKAEPKKHGDYFIKDGRFIGAFEEMYRECADPWQQDEGPSLDEDMALALLADRKPRRILDLGCGKGRFSRRLSEATGAAVTATDISPTAVRVAQSRYPEISFLAAGAPAIPFKDGSFDLVVSSGLLWCVLPHLRNLFAEISRVLEPGGRYLLLESFYQPGQQKYGNEVMEGPGDLIRLLPFELVSLVETNRLSNHRVIALSTRP